MNDTGVTDADLAHPRGLRSLENMSAEETSITKAGVDAFIVDLPNPVFVGYGKRSSIKLPTEFVEAYR